MAVDSTPATTVKNMLNGIDYSALIGGPLQAAITAQAMAAKSSWEFIQHVGLTTDKNGETKAINVTFMYQKDGSLVKLIVPILTIVPIPMIVIDNINIEFKASLNASSSECTENSSSESLDAGGEASAKLGWGPFSLEVKAKANYSSKKDSKATKDSRYSVEYTQDVLVHAMQADMPAGLATVLNILSNSVTPNAGAKGSIEVDKSVVAPTTENTEIVTIDVKDGEGLIVPGAEIELGYETTNQQAPQNLKVLFGFLKKELTLTNTPVKFTLEDGIDKLTFKADGPIEPVIFTLTYTDPNNTNIKFSSKIKVAATA